MAKVTDPKDRSFIPEQIDAYKDWQTAQKIPMVEGYFIADIDEVPVEYWDLKGVPASFVNLEGTGGTNDAYILEIPPGGKTKPQKHLYEETVYVTTGHGATTVWQPGGQKHTFEWGPGSLFAVPLNAWYQHFNSSGTEPARYFAVTNSCFMMRLFHNHDFIFQNEFQFKDRFDPETESFFEKDYELLGRFFMSTNFVTDSRTISLADYGERGRGSTNMKFDLASNTMCAHISEFPVGTYKKCHRHGPGAHVIILSGQGYSHMYPDGSDPVRYDWNAGSVIVPPDKWWHQHFNSGATPARYMAIRWNSWKYKSVMWPNKMRGATYTSVKKGGDQVEFEDEDRRIHEEFVAALGTTGATCGMCEYHPHCTKKTAASAAE